jgi:hypothetical protein
MNARTTLLIFLIFCLLKLNSQTIIQSGDVYGDWFQDGSPYLIAGDIHLPSNQRLRIWPGVQVIFQGPYGFEIEGKLDATGTQTDSITFTINDTTGFSQNNYMGWNGLSFLGLNYSFSDSSVMAYCNIEYSRFNGMTCMSYPVLIIRNSEIRYNCYRGLGLYDFSDIKVDGLVVRENKLGGFNCISSAPQVSNYVIKNNLGSGITITGSSYGNLFPFFSNGKIQNNISPLNGGGIAIDIDSYAFFEDTEIIENKALNGGGIYCGMAHCDLNKVVIIENKAENGGGIYGGYYSNVEIKFSLIVKNIADYSGGAAYINQGELNLYNSTVCANSSGEMAGGLFYNCNYTPQSTIRNSIIWNNISGEIDVNGTAPQVSYSDIQDGFTGVQNIDSDPLFVDPLKMDFRLSWNSFPEENGYKSPCIDSGDPDFSQDPDGTYSDMGAYYFDQGIYTSLNESKVISEINIYPNPAQDFLQIASDTFIDHVVICSLNGTVIISQSALNNFISIDISNLNSGIYLVKLFSNQDVLSIKKIIKK